MSGCLGRWGRLRFARNDEEGVVVEFFMVFFILVWLTALMASPDSYGNAGPKFQNFFPNHNFVRLDRGPGAGNRAGLLDRIGSRWQEGGFRKAQVTKVEVAVLTGDSPVFRVLSRNAVRQRVTQEKVGFHSFGVCCFVFYLSWKIALPTMLSLILMSTR